MTRLTLILLTAAIAGMTGISCQNPDEVAIRALVEKDSVWFNTGTEVDSTGTTGALDGDTAIVWWRGQQDRDNQAIEVHLEGDSAWVDWSQRNLGELYVLAHPPETTWVLWTKRLVETSRLRGVFMREGTPSSADRGWVLKKVSLATGRSDSSQVVMIDSMRIESATAGDVLVADPMNTYYDLESLVWFTPAEQVTVTLYTNAQEGVAFLHTFILVWPFYVRLKFNDMGGGVFSGTWNAQAIPFPRFAIFDLMTRSTIYSPDAPYDFNGWLFPYAIRTAD